MKNQEISTLIGQKRAYNSSSFLLYFSKNSENKPKNIAILAPKKIFKTAVLRNKIKRRLKGVLVKIKYERKVSFSDNNLIFSLKRGFERVKFKDLMQEVKQSLTKNGII